MSRFIFNVQKLVFLLIKRFFLRIYDLEMFD